MTKYIKPFFTANPELERMKPTADIERLMMHLNPELNNIKTYNNQIINYNTNKVRQCFLLHKGSVSLYRMVDGMVLNTESAPYVFGMSTQLTHADYLYIRVHDAAEISMLSIDRANEIIEEHNLWKNLAYLLIYTATRVYDHCTKISALTSYDVIRYQIYELMSETESVRRSVTIVKYVQDRTFLSRSGIMKILAELKKGDYIVTDKGMLVHINHIPLKY